MGVAEVTRCLSCSIGKEEGGFHFVEPFSRRLRNLQWDFPPFFSKFTSLHLFRWRVHGSLPACLPYPNDSDANYCQACGTLTRPRCIAGPVPPVDETAIQELFDKFQSVFRSNPYERQNSAATFQVPGCSLSLCPEDCGVVYCARHC